MTVLVYFMNLSIGLHLCFFSNLLHGSGLAFVEDEKRFELGGCVGAHRMSISYVHMSSIGIK
jgi:hypothetical protein